MIASVSLPMADAADTPTVRLLDASGADEAALRERARALSAEAAAPHTSRSYRFPYALVACYTAPVGVDIERIESLDPAFVSSISTPAELAAENRPDDRYGADLWSSKEALSKALGDALGYDPRRLGSPIFWPDGRSGVWRALRLRLPAGHVGWVCWRAEAADPQLG